MPLLADVAERLTSMDVEVGVQSLALAACVGDDALAAALDGRAPDDPGTVEAIGATDRVHLRAIRVAGFRGIGPEAVLDLEPGPGLTLIVGANGSGKSSFAEAVEFALTGHNTRWAKRSKVWRDGWRNLHHPDPTRVVAELTSAAGDVTVQRAWAPGAGLDDHEVAVDDGVDLDERGWSSALDLYRPFLPYSELGALVDDGPTALHDTLSAVLGLDVLADGAKRLRADRLTRQKAWKQAVEDAHVLADELDATDDARARTAADELRAKAPNPTALQDLAGADGKDLDPTMDVLRVLVGLPGPDLDAVRRATDAVDDAVDQVRGAAGSDAARDLEVADLLAAARTFHRNHGDVPCPVCADGHLDDPWAISAEAAEADLRAGAASVEGAAKVLEAARRVLAAVASEPPASLHRAGMADLDASLALSTWQTLAATRDIEDDRERAVAVRRAAEAVTNAMTDLRARAKTALAARSDAWAPVAPRVRAWAERATVARETAGRAPELKAAEDALNTVLDQVRAERWTPIADQARRVWERLGQGSSVRVEDVALAGSGTRRRVEVGVTVDGIEGAALGVMSQGELHALALSLFLPRASLPESPFGFIVIDDPVQSMDATRVTGLAEVLADAAGDRQVIVFTHDERLRDAVHAAGTPTTLVEVHRGAASTLDLRRSLA